MTTSYKKRIPENSEELIAQAHYMVVKSQADGNLTFDGHSKSLEELDNESRCRSLCARMERALTTCALEEVTGLLEMYDLLYRIGYGNMPDQRFMADQRQRVYTAWRSGNRNIQESQIYNILKKAVNGRALCTKMLKNWVRILCVHKFFPNVTAHENYQRLAIVMRENIDILIKDRDILIQNRGIMSEISCGKDAKELKREWYRANRVADLTTLTTPLLKSYRTFANSLFPTILDYESQQELYGEILMELAGRGDTSVWNKRAYRLQLEQLAVII